MKINKKILLSSFLWISLFFVLADSSQAAIVNPVIGDLGQHEGTAEGSTFINYVVALWRVSISLGSLAVILYFLLGAVEWITSAGDKSKLEKARNRIMNATIGLVLLVGSFVIIGFLSKILFGGQFDLLELTFPTPGGTGSSSPLSPSPSPSVTLPASGDWIPT